MWATRSVVQASVKLVGNPASGGLSINPRPRYIHIPASFTIFPNKGFTVLGCLWENNAIGVYQGNDPSPPVAPLFAGVFHFKSVPLAPCNRPTR